ncbi:MAG: PHP domain-containing protein [Rikenellaceae bacterium]|nr:PHP domain-containing protein [Rikenellaceae bacterium]MCL2693050.1 PHP domain-containing protein [Rikenellaceae bacterium]
MKADLHIHTVLSPCGDLEMTPTAIVQSARRAGVGIVGITDHNSTRQCAGVMRAAKEAGGVFVMGGAEITTREEVHVLAFVDGEENLARLQAFLDENLVRVPNRPDFFGYQLVVDENEQVLYEEEALLIGAINKTVDEVEAFVHGLGGIFIPAHVDKGKDSLVSQLGFVPPKLRADAFELSPRCDEEQFLGAHPYLKGRRFVRSSDAHYPDDLWRATTELAIDDEPTFEKIKNALTKHA